MTMTASLPLSARQKVGSKPIGCCSMASPSTCAIDKDRKPRRPCENEDCIKNISSLPSSRRQRDRRKGMLPRIKNRTIRTKYFILSMQLITLSGYGVVSSDNDETVVHHSLRRRLQTTSSTVAAGDDYPWQPNYAKHRCQNDAKRESWMEEELPYTIMDCCEKYFSWGNATNSCEDNSEDWFSEYGSKQIIHDATASATLYYPDSSAGVCKPDSSERPEWMTTLVPSYQECCQKHISWGYQKCIAYKEEAELEAVNMVAFDTSLEGPTEDLDLGFYADTAERKCFLISSGTKPTWNNYIASTHLECCKKYLSWAYVDCIEDIPTDMPTPRPTTLKPTPKPTSSPTTFYASPPTAPQPTQSPNPPPTSAPTLRPILYYPDTEASYCKEDSPDRPGWITDLTPDYTDCCTQFLPWVVDECLKHDPNPVVTSTSSKVMYYADLPAHKCVKNSPSRPSWILESDLESDYKECCDTHLFWVAEECMKHKPEEELMISMDATIPATTTTATTTPSLHKYYVDSETGKCLIHYTDITPTWVEIYPSFQGCCDNSWLETCIDFIPIARISEADFNDGDFMVIEVVGRGFLNLYFATSLPTPGTMQWVQLTNTLKDTLMAIFQESEEYHPEMELNLISLGYTSLLRRLQDSKHRQLANYDLTKLEFEAKLPIRCHKEDCQLNSWNLGVDTFERMQTFFMEKVNSGVFAKVLFENGKTSGIFNVETDTPVAGDAKLTYQHAYTSKKTWMPSPGPTSSSEDGEWYPDYYNHVCKSGKRPSDEGNVFKSLKECCDFRWINTDICMDKSATSPLTDYYYPDTEASYCKEDSPDRPGWITDLTPDYTDCCTQFLPWVVDECLKHNPNPEATITPSEVMYYADLPAHKCVKNSPSRPSWILESDLESDYKECCDKHLFWVAEECMKHKPEEELMISMDATIPATTTTATTTPSLHKYYIDSETGKCLIHYTDITPTWVEIYPSFQECCDNSWLETCIDFIPIARISEADFNDGDFMVIDVVGRGFLNLYFATTLPSPDTMLWVQLTKALKDTLMAIFQESEEYHPEMELNLISLGYTSLLRRLQDSKHRQLANYDLTKLEFEARLPIRCHKEDCALNSWNLGVDTFTSMQTFFMEKVNSGVFAKVLFETGKASGIFDVETDTPVAGDAKLTYQHAYTSKRTWMPSPGPTPSSEGGEWYPDYYNHVCKSGKRPSDEGNVFKSLKDCCDFRWINTDICMAKSVTSPPTSNPTTSKPSLKPTAKPTSEPTAKPTSKPTGTVYYPDLDERSCKHDGNHGSSPYQFATAEECCDNNLFDYIYCLKRTIPYADIDSDAPTPNPTAKITLHPTDAPTHEPTPSDGQYTTSIDTTQLTTMTSDGFENGLTGTWPWSTSSDLPWSTDSLEKYEGSFSARSHPVGRGEESDLHIAIKSNYGGVLSFWIKSDVQMPFSGCIIDVGDVTKKGYTYPTVWTPVAIPITAGQHEVLFRAWAPDLTLGQDSPVSDTIFLDDVSFMPTLKEGFEDGTLSWGSAVSFIGNPWEFDTGSSHEGTTSLMSPVGAGQISTMKVEVGVPMRGSVLTFWYQTNLSMPDASFTFKVNGNSLLQIGKPQTEWTQFTVSIPPGNVKLEWVYSQNQPGDGRVWIDDVYIVPRY